MTQLHFLSGLPRSGSTLLASILRQNPAIHASMSSPAGGIFSAMQKAISGGNEAAMFLTDVQREALLHGVFDAVYGPRHNQGPSIIFDTNRLWPSKLATLTRLFPNCRIICCVRRVAWIMDSIERLIRCNSMELSGIFGFEPGGTVYSRCAGLGSSNGLVGFALDALRQGYYSDEARGRMILVEYEALAKHPHHVLVALYKWLGIPMFWHDFDHIAQIPGAEDFDRKLGTPGLHSVRGKVEWRERDTILPPALFNSFPPPFWLLARNKQDNPQEIRVICCADSEPRPAQPEKPASDAEIQRMMREAQATLDLYKEPTTNV